MEEKKIADRIVASFPDAGLEIIEENTDHVIVVVPASKLLDVCSFARNDDELRFDTLASLSGVDNGENLTSVYHLFSYAKRHFIVLKVNVPRSEPRLPSVAKIWPGAGWFERESYDLLGIVYEGHGDLRRIMLPDDWVGHPLRKDYEEQEEYRGMGTTRNDPMEIPE
jgi:NADH-quinone oxidoreductase subunit C